MRHRLAGLTVALAILGLIITLLEFYRSNQGSPTFFDTLAPNEKSEKESDVMKEKSEKLAVMIYQKFRGQTRLRKELHCGVLDTWFGQIKGPHMTHAIKILQKEGRATILIGTPGSDDATIAIL